MVKILISKNYGGGWSTWNREKDVARFMLQYQPIIEAVENGERMHEEHPLVKRMIKEIKKRFGVDYVCVCGAEDLMVTEVHGPFVVREYDGNEHVEHQSDIDWIEL